MADFQIVIAGFGGQGLLFSGKVLAYAGLLEGRELSWLPSYGPEMRGGTASCSVVLSETPIGSPIVSNPDVLIAMNLPSLDRYENSVAPGGTIFVDSSLIERKVQRQDVTVHYVPATQMASDNNMPTLANMILMGKVLAVLGENDPQQIENALKKVISAKHSDMLGVNLTALEMGEKA